MFYTMFKPYLIKILKGKIINTKSIDCEYISEFIIDFPPCLNCPFSVGNNKYGILCSKLTKEELLETTVEYLEERLKDEK